MLTVQNLKSERTIEKSEVSTSLLFRWLAGLDFKTSNQQNIPEDQNPQYRH
jgi:hypothetical protein